jgi:tetratricopeptide (TPR) repeat protein
MLALQRLIENQSRVEAMININLCKTKRREGNELMTLLEIADLIVSGFEKLDATQRTGKGKYDACKGCDEWLSAWEGLKLYMAEMNIGDIWELEKKQIREFRNYNIHISFVLQLLTDELHNAGVENKIYFEKRIKYCNDFLKYLGDDRLTTENTRISIADSYFELGDEAECDRLYGEWLEADPQWGDGYVGWASNYAQEFKERKNMEKAVGIYEKALGVDGIRGRENVIEGALSCYEEIGNNDKIDELSNELSQLQAKELSQLQANPLKPSAHSGRMPASSRKIGRNEPCPCGSGKKYKKCCGA